MILQSRPDTGNDGCDCSEKKSATTTNKTKHLKATRVVCERSVQAERPEEKQVYLNYLLQTEGEFWSESGWRHLPLFGCRCPTGEIIVPSYLLQSPSWNLVHSQFWQLNSLLNHSLTHCFNQFSPLRLI